MTSFNDPRFVIAYSIILGFGLAYWWHPDSTMNGALIGAFAGAWGFYLGSSSGAQKANENVGKALDVANSVTPSTPDVILDPGQTAQAKGANE